MTNLPMSLHYRLSISWFVYVQIGVCANVIILEFSNFQIPKSLHYFKHLNVAYLTLMQQNNVVHSI